MKRLMVLSFIWGITGLTTVSASLIYVQGDVSGAWSADTVIVLSEVRVPPDSTLIIAPGVTVFFWVYCKLIVDNNATLTAVGTATDSIRFDDGWAWPISNSWHGIHFLSASSSSRLEYCHLKHGLATGLGADALGGAINCSSSNLTIVNCLIDSCIAAGIGGAIYCTNPGSPQISNNTIKANYATYGGGIGCYDSSPCISDNIISGNSTAYNGAGGGIYCQMSSPTISDNLIVGNSAHSGGGISYCYNSSSIISGNTISGNSAYSVGGIYCYNSSPSLINCILWENVYLEIYQISGSNLAATYCDIQQDWPGIGNINADPLFVNPSVGDYHLQFSSPCINTGDPNPLYNDPDGSRADMGCYPYDSTYTVVLPPTIQTEPTDFALLSCFPNPFNPTTVLSFELRVASYVRLEVFDINGRAVGAKHFPNASPSSESGAIPTTGGTWYPAGPHQITFDGTDLPSGLYFAKLTVGEFSQVQKLVLLK